MLVRFLAFLLVMSSVTASAEAPYPSRPVTIVVPYAAGGTTDVLARIIGKALTVEMGQSFIVENVGGAGGTLGTQRVVRAFPDGYTLNFGNMGSMAAVVPLYPKLGFDPRKDLVPVGLVAQVPMMLSVSNKSAITDLQDLIRRLKVENNPINIGQSGSGSTAHLAAALLLQLTKTNATLVPYRGSGPAIQDLIAGNIEVVIDQTVTMIPAHQSGTVKAIAVSGAQRLAQVPNVPTFAEGGLPSFDLVVWNALAAPAGTPRTIVSALEAALSKSLDSPEVRTRFSELAANAPVEKDRGSLSLQSLISSEVDRWSDLVKSARIETQ